MQIFFKIPLKATELTLDITLQCGQSFRWFKTKQNQWRGVLGSNVWTLYQDEDFMYCEVTEKNASSTEKQGSHKNSSANSSSKDEDKPNHYERIIRNYFRLDVPLEPLYNKWSDVDPNFKEKALSFPGVRILDQNPVENTFSFICSSNNNIQRITKLVDHLCSEFGFQVATIDDHEYYSFPDVAALSKNATESRLKELGFGYRAKYIASSAKMIMEKGGENWLHSLKALNYEECHQNLTLLTGIGDKVADCICLMSMGHLDAIPVDTHVFQIAARDYLPHLRKTKSVTPKVYKEIVHHFQGLYGSYSGWAHSVLFSSNLKKFQPKDEEIKKPGNQKSKKCSFPAEGGKSVCKRIKMSKNSH